ncbi:uncharacterized protein [Ptychodera flava]|uniref:uncharacterized protein isoform X2 n=1 Tax=Ptychodera flava TaxID=63121 RepID=UPI00396A30FB
MECLACTYSLKQQNDTNRRSEQTTTVKPSAESTSATKTCNAEDGTFHENEKLLHNHVGDDADLKGYDSVSNSDDGSKDGKDQKKKKLQTGSLLRLLSYSAPDWCFLLSGILALLATSAGEIFLPMFTGQVVDGIVVEHSYKKFTDAIIIMSLISVGM